MRNLNLLQTLLLPLALLAGCRSSTSASDQDRLVERGWMQIELGDAAGALASFELAGSAPETLAGRAQALAALGALRQARAAYLEAIELEPQVADWRVGLGVVEASMHDDRAALAAFDLALELDPDSPKAFYNRGRLHAAAGRNSAALEDYSAAIRRFDRFAEAYMGRGLVQIELGDTDAAIADFHRAGGLSPCPEAHVNCAVLHYAEGNVRHALTELNTAIRLEGSNAVFYANRGRIYLDLGQFELAAADFEDAMGLGPGVSAYRELYREATETEPKSGS